MWDVVVIDFTGPLPKTSSGFQYILTATDCFSKWVEAFPQSSESAAEVSKNLCTLIYRYGCPRCILSRKKQDFVNEVSLTFHLSCFFVFFANYTVRIFKSCILLLYLIIEKYQ